MVANVISVAHFTVMAGDRHGELAAKDLSMIAVALTPSSFLLIQQLCHFSYISIISVLFLNTKLRTLNEC